jgi:outer membrane protein assembly factor BamB
LFGGSSIEAGGGARAVARECVLFAFDTKTQRKIWEEVVVKGDHSVGGLTAAEGKIFGVTMPSSTLIVIDPKTFQVLSKTHIPFGHFREISLGYFEPHKKLYGLAGQSLFAVDPETFAISEVARSKGRITCGFAITKTGVYFGSGKDLVRWKW